MGIDLVWQDERGRELGRVADPLGRLSLLVLAIPLGEYSCLRRLDPYGDACFDPPQFPALLKDLRHVSAAISDEQFAAYFAERADRAWAAGWQESVVRGLDQEAKRARQQGTATQVREHLEQVIRLVDHGLDAVHTRLCFHGD